MEQNKHFFFAVKLPDETKVIMKKHLEKLQKMFSFKSWVHHEDLHITLVFLGSVPFEMLEKAENDVSKRLIGLKPFHVRMNRLGIFGKQDSPRIFFADMADNNELQLVRKQVFDACEKTGFQLESRPFRPHITLSRKWTGEEAFQKEMLSVWGEIQPEPSEFEAVEIALYQTHPQKTPKYEAIRLYSLDENSQ